MKPDTPLLSKIQNVVAKTVDLVRQYTGRDSVADVIQSGVIKATCLRITL